jgi:hypothetical protein
MPTTVSSAGDRKALRPANCFLARKTVRARRGESPPSVRSANKEEVAGLDCGSGSRPGEAGSVAGSTTATAGSGTPSDASFSEARSRLKTMAPSSAPCPDGASCRGMSTADFSAVSPVSRTREPISGSETAAGPPGSCAATTGAVAESPPPSACFLAFSALVRASISRLMGHSARNPSRGYWRRTERTDNRGTVPIHCPGWPGARSLDAEK